MNTINKLCECGCGLPTPIATETRSKRGIIKGQPTRFIRFHQKVVPLEERFWGNVNRVDDDTSCWLWSGVPDSRGYGRLQTKGKYIGAHRLSYILAYGNIDSGLYVCHRCDTPLCVRPSHLFLGTCLDNIADRHSKCRDARGERSGRYTHPERTARGERNGMVLHPGLATGSKNGNAKLTDEDVVLIRKRVKSGEQQKEVAIEYGLAQNTVWKIVHKKSWVHLT